MLLLGLWLIERTLLLWTEKGIEYLSETDLNVRPADLAVVASQISKLAEAGM